MTAEEHIVAYIESDKQFYDRLLAIYRWRKHATISLPTSAAGAAWLARSCASLAADTYSYMRRHSECEDYSASVILCAAIALTIWEAPEGTK